MSRPIFATAPIISNLATFAEALDLTRRTFGRILPYWRGHGNVDWSLTAEVFRTPSHGSHHPEITLIRNFMGRAESRSHRCPAYDDYVGWLMLARHFYLPTRLLDWSMSPLVALFFAVEHHEEVDGALWALHPALLNQSMIGENRVLILDDPPIQELVKLAFNPDPALHQAAAPRVKGWGLAVGAREIDARVMVQQGAFTIHADDTDLATKPTDKDARPYLVGFRVEHSAKANLRGLLQVFGITRSSLFPDLGSLALDLKNTIWASR